MDNTPLEKLKYKIAGRTVGVMSHGKSIEELKKRIQEFKDLDICWTSFNLYPIMDKQILIEIDKKLSIVLECAAGRTKEFETSIRMPRMIHYITKGALILSTWRLLRTQYEQMGISHLTDTLMKRYMVLCDDILGEINVPNSLALLVYTLAIAEPKRIVLFGVDGYKKEQGNEFATYFMPTEQRIYREQLLGGKLEYTLHETTSNFEQDFITGYNNYCNKLNIEPPEIINCSPNSLFTKIPIITYEDLIKKIEN